MAHYSRGTCLQPQHLAHYASELYTLCLFSHCECLALSLGKIKEVQLGLLVQEAS